MDPNATFKALTQACKDKDFVAMHDHASNLRDWLDKGGFTPAGYSRRFVRMCIERTLRETTPIVDY
jgi:hypothetical protein